MVHTPLIEKTYHLIVNIILRSILEVKLHYVQDGVLERV